MLSHFVQRELIPEVMDDPTLDPDLHRRALRGLARINRLSNSADSMLREMMRRKLVTPGADARVADVACGGGDVTHRLLQLADAKGLSLELIGLDRSPVAVAHAQAAANTQAVQFQTIDALQDDWPSGIDGCVCSLFLHHLAEEEVVQLLLRMGEAGRWGVVNDLRRSAAGWAAAAIGTRILSRSPVVHVDGPRSVRAAFTVAEMQQMAADAGLKQVSVRPQFPFRMMMSWRQD